MAEAATNVAAAGKVTMVALEGAGAGTSVSAKTAVMEAAAMRTAQEIFFMSMAAKEFRRRKRETTPKMTALKMWNEFILYMQS